MSNRFSPSAWQEAYKRGDERVASFYATDCFTTASRIGNGLTREALSEWKAFLRPHCGDESLLAPLDQLSDPNATVVVTGQQAVAGMGPLLALHKIFAAKHWAAEHSRRTGKPCIPVYWIASDDHDLAEVATAAWLRADGLRAAFDLAEDGSNTHSVFDVAIAPDRSGQLLEELAATTVASEFRDSILGALRESLAGEHPTFESHVLHLFCGWLLPLGIIPVVPRLGFLRNGARGIMRREIERPLESTRLMLEASAALDGAGCAPPIHRSGNEVNFFLTVDGQRGKVTFENREFVVTPPGAKGDVLARMSGLELLGILDREPQRFSPNAALRPLVQDAVLPTVAYVAGPTELVYHAQIGSLYGHFEVNRPAVIPRPNVVFTERKIERALEKLGAPVDWATLATAGEFEERLNVLAAEQDSGSAADRHVDALFRTLGELEESLADEQRDPAVKKSMEKLRGNVETGVEKLRERIQHHRRTRDEDKQRARERVLEYLFPGGSPQERSVGPLSPLLIQFGEGILPKLQKAINYEAEGFQRISLSDLQ
jgi:bacillithiol biosynthesis cysteine-adding enzyme BshC